MVARIGVTKKVTSWTKMGSGWRCHQEPGSMICIYKAFCTGLVWPRWIFSLWVRLGIRG